MTQWASLFMKVDDLFVVLEFRRHEFLFLSRSIADNPYAPPRVYHYRWADRARPTVRWLDYESEQRYQSWQFLHLSCLLLNSYTIIRTRPAQWKTTHGVRIYSEIRCSRKLRYKNMEISMKTRLKLFKPLNKNHFKQSSTCAGGWKKKQPRSISKRQLSRAFRTSVRLPLTPREWVVPPRQNVWVENFEASIPVN